MTDKQGITFETLKTWKDGLQELNIEKIRSALQSGVPPSTYVDCKHPLHSVLQSSEINSHGDRLHMPRMSNRNIMSVFSSTSLSYEVVKPGDVAEPDNDPSQTKSDIIDLLLEYNVPLLDSLKGSEQRVVDSVLLDNDAILVSKLVLAAIKQSVSDQNTGLYQFDIEDMLEAAKPEDGADVLKVKKQKRTAEDKLQKLAEIHNYVHMVLTNPSDNENRDFVTKHADKLSFWTNDFEGPDEELIDKIFPIDEDKLRKAEEESQDIFSMFGLGGKSAKTETEDKIITLEKEEPEAIMRELDQYTGVESFKNNMRALMLRVHFDQARQAHGLATDVQNYHTAFLGNPGTGKTTGSRLKARMLHSLGMAGPRYAELSRDSIISKYFGNTEGKVKELIDNVDILFVDEAYSLVDGSDNRHDYGYRAVDTMVAAMGNRKDSFTLFVAGYSEPMKRFIAANEGLSSRIKIFEDMRDFTTEELGLILDDNIEAQGYILEPEVREHLCRGIEAEREQNGERNFGNARVIVSLVQDLPNHMAYRLGQENDGHFEQFNAAALSRITKEDVDRALYQRGVTMRENPNQALVDEVLLKDKKSAKGSSLS